MPSSLVSLSLVLGGVVLDNNFTEKFLWEKYLAKNYLKQRRKSSEKEFLEGPKNLNCSLKTKRNVLKIGIKKSGEIGKIPSNHGEIFHGIY